MLIIGQLSLVYLSNIPFTENSMRKYEVDQDNLHGTLILFNRHC